MEPFTLLLALLDVVHGQPTFTAALRATVREICARTDWVIGEAWLPRDDGKLELVEMQVGRDEARFRPFTAGSRGAVFRAGEGLPGRVFASGRHEWIRDVSALDTRTYKRAELAREVGLHAALGVPVVAGAEVFAVLAFYMERAHDQDRSVEVVSATARQLGLVLRQKRAQEAIDRLAGEVERLSTPILQVGEWIALAPLVGELDAPRVGQLTERVLAFLEQRRARVVIVDVTGVPNIETAVAKALMDLALATRMLGARTILTGLRAALARTLVHLGVSFEHLDTQASLSGALRLANEIADAPVTRRMALP